MTRVLILSLVTLALAGAAHGASPSFSARVTNRWFPLAPGYWYTQDALYMPAHPHVGQTGRQEYHNGEAADHFKVLSLLGANVVLTQEWTPLKPGVIDHKLYVRGIGVVVAQAEHGGNERNALVSFSRS